MVTAVVAAEGDGAAAGCGCSTSIAASAAASGLPPPSLGGDRCCSVVLAASATSNIALRTAALYPPNRKLPNIERSRGLFILGLCCLGLPRRGEAVRCSVVRKVWASGLASEAAAAVWLV